MQALTTVLDVLRSHPYLALVVSFLGALSYGLVKLAALLPTL